LNWKNLPEFKAEIVRLRAFRAACATFRKGSAQNQGFGAKLRFLLRPGVI
jgi:hypothetical protein